MELPAFESNTVCELGEGLALGPNGIVAWLDIYGNHIFVLRSDSEQCFPLKSQATVIFRVSECSLEFGSEIGIVTLDLSTGQESLLVGPPAQKRDGLRSNDGCHLDGGRYLMGFMHASDPSSYPGQVFYFCGEMWHLIDDDIAIPNTFLEISKNEFLISDSLLGVVWKYRIGMHGALSSKTNWMKFEDGTPDGGCIHNEYALISLWDGGCLARINLASKERVDYPVPVPRPTNCAVDPNSSKLWVTSARVGLNSEILKQFPLSGKTFSFEGLL